MKGIETAALWISAIGAINWGLSKFVSIDLITKLPNTMLQTGAYALVAASGGYVAYLLFNKKI